MLDFIIPLVYQITMNRDSYSENTLKQVSSPLDEHGQSMLRRGYPLASGEGSCVKGEYVKEAWKDVEGYDGIYQVSNKGNIRSLKRYIYHKNGAKHIIEGQLLIPYITKKGYRQIKLWKNNNGIGFKCSRLVAKAFIPNPLNLPEVNHLNASKVDNRVENLEWCTRSHNIKHSFIHGTRKCYGEHHSQSILTDSDVYYIREMKDQKSINEFAKMFRVHKATIWSILNNKNWKHLLEVEEKKP
jgi:hypothetical protein